MKLFKFFLIKLLLLTQFSIYPMAFESIEKIKKEKCENIPYKNIEELCEYFKDFINQVAIQTPLVLTNPPAPCLKLDKLDFDILRYINNNTKKFYTEKDDWLFFRLFDFQADLKKYIGIVHLSNKSKTDQEDLIEKISNAYKKIIDELKNGWVKNYSKKKELQDFYILTKQQTLLDEDKLIGSLIKKFNLASKVEVTTAPIPKPLVDTNLLIKKEHVDEVLTILNFNISYSPTHKEKLKKIINFLQNSLQTTNNLPTVLNSMILDYFGTNIYLFQLSPKDVDNFIKSQADSLTPNNRKRKEM